jgi:hypothetical protein
MYWVSISVSTRAVLFVLTLLISRALVGCIVNQPPLNGCLHFYFLRYGNIAEPVSQMCSTSVTQRPCCPQLGSLAMKLHLILVLYTWPTVMVLQYHAHTINTLHILIYGLEQHKAEFSEPVCLGRNTLSIIFVFFLNQ